MTTKLTFPLMAMVLIAGAVIAMPTEAMAAVTQTASTAATYWQEIAIGAAAIAGMILLDTTSWSLMTPKD